MSKYFPYSSPIHRPMTESSTGLPVSEPSISTGSRRESLTRQVPRPHSSTALYPPLYRQRDLQFDQPSHELFATQTKHPPLPAHRLSPWTPDRSSTYDEELFDFDEELSSLQISSRNPTLRHSRHYSRDPEPLSRDPFMIDHLPPSSSLLPREHHHQHHHQQQHHHHHFHPQNRNRGAARFNHPRTSHDQYSGRNVLPHYALKPFQDINTVGDPYYSPGRRATISGSPDPYGIDAEGETFASGAEFLPEVSPFERLDYVPRTVQQPISSSSLPLSEQDLQLQHEQQQAMIGEGGDVIEDPTNPENWPDTKDNDIVKRAKTMYTMAYSMYQFTRGEGELKTTQDLFTQAEFLTEEANKFYKVVRQFTYQVPSGQMKKDLLDHLNNVPTFVQQLQFSVKNSTVGKAATFTKVDNIIQETKDLMNFISKTVNSCLACASMYNLDMVSRTRSRTLSPTGRGGPYDYDDDRMGSKGGGSSSDASL